MSIVSIIVDWISYDSLYILLAVLWGASQGLIADKTRPAARWVELISLVLGTLLGGWRASAWVSAQSGFSVWQGALGLPTIFFGATMGGIIMALLGRLAHQLFPRPQAVKENR